MRSRFLLLCSLVLACTTCSKPPPEPPAPWFSIDKNVFRPDRRWYVAETVVKGQFAGIASVTGSTAPLEKIRWELTESYLIGYRAYSLYWGQGDTGTLNTQTDPIVQFRITSWHNVFNGRIVSQPEIPWNQKSHFSVDWSVNLTNPFAVSRRNAFTVNQLSDPDAMVISDDYVEITTRYAMDSSRETEGWSTTGMPRCSDGDFMYCEANEFTSKWSMYPVDDEDDRQYEVVPITQVDQAKFQMFRKSFLYVDPLLGNTEAGKRFFADTYKIWKTSHDADGHPIPYRQRELQPVVWYLNPEYPPELVEATAQALTDWDSAFNDAVNGRRYWECRDANEPDATCQLIKREHHDIVKLCPHNPVQEGDDPDCGPAGRFVRLGDLRYNSIQWVTEAVLYPTAGIGWFNVDHENARIVSSTVFLNGYGLRRYTGEFAVAAQLMNGDLTLGSDYFRGNDLIQRINQTFASSQFGPYTPVSSRFSLESTLTQGPWPGLPFPVDAPSTPEALQAKLNALDLSWLDGAELPPVNTSNPRAFMASLSDRLNAAVDQGRLGPPPAQVEAWKRKLLDSPLEDQLIGQDELWAAGIPDTTGLTQAQIRERASPLRERPQPPELDSRVFAEPIRDGAYDAIYASFASEMKGRSFDVVAAEVLKRGMRGFVAHELGHCFGLRHNFAGSYDAMNYPAEYWRIRNDGNVGPRWKDPMTAQELQQGLLENSYSSVMDYFGAMHERNQGIGRYDRAIIKYIYGNLIEVFNDPVAVTNGSLANQVQLWHNSGLASGVFYTPSGQVRGIHYTQYPQLFGDLNNREDVPSSKLVDRYDVGIPLALPDGRPAVPYRACSDIDKVFATCRPGDRGADPYEIALDGQQRFYSYYSNLHFRRDRLWSMAPDVGPLYFDFFKVLSTTLVLQETSVPDRSLLVTDDGLAAVTLGLGVGLKWMTDVITLPEPGLYAMRTNPPWLPMYQYVGTGGTAQPGQAAIAPGDGWFFSTETQGPEAGKDYRNRVLWWGVAPDKTAAVKYLTEPMNFLPNSDTLPNAQAFYATVLRAYKDPALEFFRSALSLDWPNLGPFYDPAISALRRRDWSSSTAVWPPAGTALSPSLPYSTRNFIRTQLLNSLAGLANNADIDLMRVTVNGAADDFATTLPTVTFSDPSSGRTYRALSKLSGTTELGIGAAMLNRANALYQASQDGALTTAQRSQAASNLQVYVREVEHLRMLVRMHDTP